MVREASLLAEALEQLCGALPFWLRRIDTDNGSEFLDETMVSYCGQEGIEMTRSRLDRKNDQACLGQKNGVVVRRLVRYGRLAARRGLTRTRWAGTSDRPLAIRARPASPTRDSGAVSNGVPPAAPSRLDPSPSGWRFPKTRGSPKTLGTPNVCPI